jgi:regulatory protein
MYKPRSGERRVRTLDTAWVERAVAEHLARYSCTRAHLRTLIDRRIRKAAREGGVIQPDLMEQLDVVLERHVGLGTLNDAAWAEMKARSLTRRGVGKALVAQRLRQEGIPDARPALDVVAEELQGSDEEELVPDIVAACAWARRKRVGAFAREAEEVPEPTDRGAARAARDATRAAEQKVLAAMGRAGFSYQLARRVLELSREEAEELLFRLR